MIDAMKIKIISLLSKPQNEIRRSYKFREQFQPLSVSLTEREKLKLLPPRSTC
jgi:hypothetical protein